MLNVILVDDEERGLIALKRLIEGYTTGLKVTHTFTNITEAAAGINEQKPDVIFLDIEMPGGNGFELLEQLNRTDIDIVFVTAYQEYAIKAIKFSAFDYLLKPVTITDIRTVADRLTEKKLAGGNERIDLLRKNVKDTATGFNKLVLSGADGYYLVNLQDILYCKADDSYTHFMLTSGKQHLVSRTLKEYEELLESHHFYRIHKSFLVNLAHVQKVIKADGASVQMINGEELPVSFRKKEDFFTRLKSM